MTYAHGTQIRARERAAGSHRECSGLNQTTELLASVALCDMQVSYRSQAMMGVGLLHNILGKTAPIGPGQFLGNPSRGGVQQHLHLNEILSPGRSAPSGNFLEMQILRLHPRPSTSFNQPPKEYRSCAEPLDFLHPRLSPKSSVFLGHAELLLVFLSALRVLSHL